MREGWTYKKLGEVCKVIMGQSPDGKSVNDSNGVEFHQGKVFFGEKYLKVSNSFTEQPSKIAEPNSVLLCVRAPVGVVNLTLRRICIGRGLCAIQPNDKIIMPFIYYALTTKQTYFDKNSTGSTFKAISSNIVTNTVIPVPPVGEQERIVAELDLLSGIIEKKKEQLKAYDQLAQSIFYTMFGDLLEANPTKNLKDVASYYIGLTYKPTDVSEQGTIVLRSSNIQNNILDFNDIVRVNLNVGENKTVKDGDILMCARNGSARLVGKVARIRNINEKMSFGAFMTIIRSEYNDFLFHFFLSDFFRSQLTTSKTATINQITSRMLDNIKLNVPPLSLQQEFAEKIAAIERQKELVQQSIEETQTMFDCTMEKYFG